MEVTPDGRKRLSEGVVVEASVVARILGVRLLRLDADIVLAPGDVTVAPAAASSSELSPQRSSDATARSRARASDDLLPRRSFDDLPPPRSSSDLPPARSSELPPARPSSAARARSGAIGGGLAEAVRTIDEGAALLAEARRNGSTSTRGSRARRSRV